MARHQWSDRLREVSGVAWQGMWRAALVALCCSALFSFFVIFLFVFEGWVNQLVHPELVGFEPEPLAVLASTALVWLLTLFPSLICGAAAAAIRQHHKNDRRRLLGRGAIAGGVAAVASSILPVWVGVRGESMYPSGAAGLPVLLFILSVAVVLGVLGGAWWEWQMRRRRMRHGESP